MKSIAFPDMFRTASTNMVKDKEATANNLRLLLASEKNELIGDPYYGVTLKKYLFEQNNYVLQDIIIDDIYTAIKIFMPQIIVDRKNITITSDGYRLFASIKLTYQQDFTTDMYNIVLFQGEE